MMTDQVGYQLNVFNVVKRKLPVTKAKRSHFIFFFLGGDSRVFELTSDYISTLFYSSSYSLQKPKSLTPEYD